MAEKNKPLKQKLHGPGRLHFKGHGKPARAKKCPALPTP
jgi:hypothetical protein